MSAIPPGGGSPPKDPKLGKLAAGPQGRSHRSASETGIAASEAERDAQKRIYSASERAAQAERESRQRIDEVHDEYVRRSETESARNEELVEAERNRGYKAIRDLQRAQAAELSRVKREGDRTLGDLRNYYRDSTYSTELKGNQELQRLKGQNFDQIEAEGRARDLALEQARVEHGIQVDSERAFQESQRTELVEQGRAEYEKTKRTTHEATERAHQHFQERYQDTMQDLETQLGDLQRKTGRRLEDIREETAAKLAAFNEQKSDPFYRLVDIDARMSETSDGFIVVAKIPPHEREHVSVSLKGDNIVISGARRNEEDFSASPGHKITTHSFQSYAENFPLNWPVEGKKLSRRFEGDYLVVEVPKKKYLNRPQPYQADRPERIRAERPKFPSNIPYSEPAPDLSRRPMAAENGISDSRPGARRTRKGGTTLG